MKTTKRQTKQYLPRGSELSEVAAQLLQYLDKTPAGRERAAVQTDFQSAGNTAEAVQLQAAESARERAETPWLPLQHTARTGNAESAPAASAQELRDFRFAPDDAGGKPAAEVYSPLQRPAASQLRTMDEISEFFRRDSRRYDRGFSGGNGA